MAGNKSVNKHKYAPNCLQIKDSTVKDNKLLKRNFLRSIAARIDFRSIQIKTTFKTQLKIQMKTPFLYIQQQKKKLKITSSF